MGRFSDWILLVYPVWCLNSREWVAIPVVTGVTIRQVGHNLTVLRFVTTLTASDKCERGFDDNSVLIWLFLSHNSLEVTTDAIDQRMDLPRGSP